MIGQTISAEGFSHCPESRIRFSPAGLAMSGRGIQLCRALAPGTPGSCLQHCLEHALRPNGRLRPVSQNNWLRQPAAYIKPL